MQFNFLVNKEGLLIKFDQKDCKVSSHDPRLDPIIFLTLCLIRHRILTGVITGSKNWVVSSTGLIKTDLRSLRSDLLNQNLEAKISSFVIKKP